MCIVFVCKEKRPADDVLVRADDKNSDGIGIAWREKGLVKWEKGLSIEELLKRLHVDCPPLPFVMHFRSATAGGEAKELCHPFVVSPSASTALKGSAKEVLFHNGTWSGWEYKIKENLFRTSRRIPPGPWSDSRAFAWHVGTYGREVLSWLDLKGEQRICLFSGKETHLLGSWSEADGFLHSNPTHSTSGAINITSKKEFEEKHRKLSKRERRALRAAAKSDLTPTQKLLEAARNCTLGKQLPSGRLHRNIPSWQTDEGLDAFDPSRIVDGVWTEPDDDDEERKAIPSWPDHDDELPIIDLKQRGTWSQAELKEILEELRLFSWRTFKLVRPRQPSLSH